MKDIARWVFALIIVAACFTFVTWLCGAIILPDVLKDPVVRWTLATAAGVALDGFVAKWAFSFAKGGESDDAGTAKTRAGKTRNSIRKATILGPVTQGRDIAAPASINSRQGGESAAGHDEVARTGAGDTKNSITDAFISGAVIMGRDIDQAIRAGSELEEPGGQERLRAEEHLVPVRNEIPDGIYSTVIMGRDITAVLPRDPVPVMAGLRDASEVFAGRGDDLAQVIELLDPATEQAPRTITISGLPGVGKTELAVHAAHAALSAGWFPGGVLFIDMFGYDPERAVTTAAALESLLRKIGMHAEHLPAAEQDRSLLLTSVLARYAEKGKPVLVVIDNVSASAQAAPLLPAAGKVIVTSRHKLPLQNAKRLDLDRLSESAGVELLASELRLVADGDPRVVAEPDDAARVARLCDGLPLALQIVAALLAAHPMRALSTMVTDLQDTRTRLDEMRFQEPGGAELAVRSAFDLSYGQLDARQALIFQLLPMNQGPEISTAAVAVMASLDERDARRSLDELERAHLIESGSADGRWRMHDLLHVYAAGLGLSAEDRRNSILVLLAYYAEMAGAAARHLDPTAAQAPEDPFADRAQALAWLDTEYPNLVPFGNVVILTQPVVLSPFTTADLFLHLWRYFELRRLTDDWIRLTEFALLVSRGLEDRRREGEALTKLSGAFRQARRFDEAIEACQDAIVIQRDLGDQRAEGMALNNLAAAFTEATRYDEAIVSAREAAVIFQEIGDRHREGIAAANLGNALTGRGRYSEGAAAYEEAAGIFREAGDWRGESGVLTNLGTALHHAGKDLTEIIDLHRRSVARMAEIGDRHGQAIALANLSGALIDAERADEGISAARDAVTVMRDAHDPHNLASALVNLGTALVNAGRAGDAAEAFGEAVTAYRRIGDRDSEAKAQISLGNAVKEAGDRDRAMTAFRAAAEICQETANQRREGQALCDLGYALGEAGRLGEAMTTLRAAVTASRAAGDHEGEGRALLFLGGVLSRSSIDEAISAFSDAADLYRQAGREDLADLALRARQGAEKARQARDDVTSRLAAGRFEEVIAEYRAASLHEIADRGIVGDAASELGVSLSRAGRFSQATAILEEAVAAFHEAGEQDHEHAARAELESARQAQLDAQAAADALSGQLGSASPSGQALSAALDEAIRHLGSRDARFLRLLSVSPGPHISLAAAALIADADRDVIHARVQELARIAESRNHQGLSRRMRGLYRTDAALARGSLGVLMQMQLVEQDPAEQDRWRLPTVIRPFVTEQGRKYAEQDLRGPVQTLLHLYYLGGAYAASASLDDGVVAPALQDDQAQGLRWLAAEYLNLVATVNDAQDDDLGAVIALDLTRSLTHVMSLERQFDDAITLTPKARRAAQRLNDRHAEAVVIRNLGIKLMQAGRQDEAITTLRDALAIYQDLGDPDGEGTTLTNLGTALTFTGQFTEADTALRTAIDIHRRRGRRFSEAVALSRLGALLDLTDHPDEAVTALTDADLIYRKIGDQHHRSVALVQLADIMRRKEHDDEAVTTYRRAATLARLSGDLPLAKAALARLADTYRATGQQTEADHVLQEADQLAPDHRA